MLLCVLAIITKRLASNTSVQSWQHTADIYINIIVVDRSRSPHSQKNTLGRLSPKADVMKSAMEVIR